MTDLAPRFKRLIVERTAQVSKDTGLDKTPFEDRTSEQIRINMLCDCTGFEIKARLAKLFAALDAEALRGDFDVIDESAEEVKHQFERESRGTQSCIDGKSAPLKTVCYCIDEFPSRRDLLCRWL